MSRTSWSCRPIAGLFRIDGLGDEYGGGVCGGFDFGGGEEGGGGDERIFRRKLIAFASYVRDRRIGGSADYTMG